MADKTTELREHQWLIPILMKFGTEFAPIEHPETVNKVTDKAICAIGSRIHQAIAEMPAYRDVLDERNLTLVEGRPPHWVDWNYGYNEGVVDCLAVLRKLVGEQ